MDFSQEKYFPKSNLLRCGGNAPQELLSGAPFPHELECFVESDRKKHFPESKPDFFAPVVLYRFLEHHVVQCNTINIKKSSKSEFLFALAVFYRSAEHNVV
jgi:hypothetical protein